MHQRHAHRNGIAMLLVLISLAMGTILSMAYLASRDNSIAIGANVADAAAARWAAITGLDMGTAVLETNTDWAITIAAGRLIDSLPVGVASVDVDIIDLETGEAPTLATDFVELRSTAIVNGVEQVARATAEINPSGLGESLDVDLSEFAVFTADFMKFTNQSIVARWPSSPLAPNGDPVLLGTLATTLGSVTLNDTSEAIDAIVYHQSGASDSLVTDDQGDQLDQVSLNDFIPLPDPPSAPGALPIGLLTTLMPRVPLDLSTDVQTGFLQLETGYTGLSTSGPVTLIAEQGVAFNQSSGTTIDGPLTMVVYGDMSMGPDSFIELSDTGSLDLYVFGDVTLNDAYIGDVRADQSVRDNSGEASWMDPNRVQVYTIPAYTLLGILQFPVSQTWIQTGNSVVKGELYVPGSDIVIADTSALYGRVAADTMTMGDSAALFYDPMLDSGRGFSNPDSELFTAPGTIVAPVKALASLGVADLTLLATSLSQPIYTTDDSEVGTEYQVDVFDYREASPSDPTPRPIEVALDITSFGSALEEWADPAFGNGGAADFNFFDLGGFE